MLATINHWIEQTQYVLFALTSVWLWFYRRGNEHPMRGQAMLTVMAVLFSHVMVHLWSDLWFHSSPPAFFRAVIATHQGWEAFYLQWFIAPSSMATWMAFAVTILRASRMAGLLLCLLALCIGWIHVVANLAWPSDVLYALLIGAACGWGLLLALPHMRRFIWGIEQLSIHIPQIVYPCMLLLMIDLDNDLQFLTASFHFMFGGSQH